MITMNEIREKFPNPRSNPESRDSYCVGGALCKFIGEPCHSFPHVSTLAKAIMLASSKTLVVDKSIFYARRIIAFNDRKDFESAWKELDFALSKG